MVSLRCAKLTEYQILRSIFRLSSKNDDSCNNVWLQFLGGWVHFFSGGHFILIGKRFMNRCFVLLDDLVDREICSALHSQPRELFPERPVFQ